MAKISNYPDGEHSVEFYDAREKASKAKWHYDRAGKQRGASLSKGIKADYESELLRRGVKDSDGNQKPLERKEDRTKQQSLHHTRLLNVGNDDKNVQTGFAFRD